MISVHNLVSITDFRNDISLWLKKVSDRHPVVIMQNSKPKAVVIDPVYYEYLEKYAGGFFDEGDIQEVQRAKERKREEHVIPFDITTY